MDHKARIQKSVENWSKSKLPKERKKTNSNPEGKFVLVLKKHLESLGFSVDVVEAKAVFNESAGRYMSGKVRPGFPDICGNSKGGLSVWIEVKAPGRRNEVRPEQRNFLIEKIETNCFAIVCDSIAYFDNVWAQWSSSLNRRALLMRELPELSSKWEKIIEKDLEFGD